MLFDQKKSDFVHLQLTSDEMKLLLFLWCFPGDIYFRNPGRLGGVHWRAKRAESQPLVLFSLFAGPVSSGDVEKGSKTLSNSNLGEILPVYRQDSHLLVHGGSHDFPGEGTYLLKFDNSYSLWRNKTLYYRVYYSA